MKLKQVGKFLAGKKTFVVGGLMILLGILQGDNEMLLTGVGFITVRLGIANK